MVCICSFSQRRQRYGSRTEATFIWEPNPEIWFRHSTIAGDHSSRVNSTSEDCILWKYSIQDLTPAELIRSMALQFRVTGPFRGPRMDRSETFSVTSPDRW